MEQDDELTAARAAERRLRFLLERARGGDQCALPGLREVMDTCPEIWRRHGDLALAAEAAWVELVAGDDLVAREALPRRLAELKAELAGAMPMPIVNLLAERAVTCWLQASYADAAAAKSRDVDIALARFAQERQDKAHRRYLTSLTALATAQRLLRPASATKDDEAPADATAAVDSPGPSLAVVDIASVAADSPGALRTPRPPRSGRSA